MFAFRHRLLIFAFCFWYLCFFFFTLVFAFCVNYRFVFAFKQHRLPTLAECSFLFVVLLIWEPISVSMVSSSSSQVGSGIVPVDGVGQISCSHCLYHASLFCSITCILFHQSIFLHLILYLLFPHLFRSFSCSTRYATTAHFKFQSLHYHIFIYDRGYHRMLFALAILSKDPVMPNMSTNSSLFLRFHHT